MPWFSAFSFEGSLLFFKTSSRNSTIFRLILFNVDGDDDFMKGCFSTLLMSSISSRTNFISSSFKRLNDDDGNGIVNNNYDVVDDDDDDDDDDDAGDDDTLHIE